MQATWFRRKSPRRQKKAVVPVDDGPLRSHPPEYYAQAFALGRRPGVTPAAPPAVPAVRLELSDRATLAWRGDDAAAGRMLPRDDGLGARVQAPGARPERDREIVLGLDFGTSSTKVVIADRTLRAAYAVPFCDAAGVAAFLLPSALVEDARGRYGLSGKGIRHADLKLAMLQSPDDEGRCAKVCAFLALVIRSARAWLFEAKRNQLLRTDILWALALGQPAGQAAQGASREWFEQLGRVAWLLAGQSKPPTVASALEAWRGRGSLDSQDEVEVRPMAELSAQIHGFVSSSHFDPVAQNRYLLVDVGAGTVDASVFRVFKEPAGRTSFELFTHAVQPLGAANLNRHRIGWWQEQLREVAKRDTDSASERARRADALIAELERLRVPTEHRGHYPRHYDGYLAGVKVHLSGGAKSPDERFLLGLRNHVAGTVLWRAWKNRLLTQDDVRDMPFFLCGGGSRHAFYAGLAALLARTENCTWLTTRPRDLVLPSNLQAPGLNRSEYDRLSVAYGLSQLEQGRFTQITNMLPKVLDAPTPDWGVPLSDKSAC